MRQRRGARARRPHPCRGSSVCTSCRCHTGRDHCVRAWPSRSPLQQEGCILCTERCWRMPDSMSFSSHSIVTLRRRRARQDARAAVGWCTRRGSGASRVAGRAAQRGVRPAVQLLLLGGSVPQPQDAAVVPLSRPQGLARRRGGAGCGDAARGDGNPAVDGAFWRQPADHRALADVVGQRVRGEPVLEGGSGRRLHAAGRPRPAAGVAAGALCRRRRGAARRAAALYLADQRRRGDARCMTGIAGPQSMPVAGRRSLVLRLRLLAFGSAGVSQRRGSRVHEQWAHFRFSVIGQLLAAPPRKGMLRLELDQLAACAWRHPVSGEPVRFGVSTLERWYYRARKERHDPVAVLRRKLRKDAGAQAAMGAAVCQAVLAQYAAHKSWSVKLHHDNVLALAERNPALTPVPSYSTLRRFLAAHGLDKRRRLTSRRTDGAERAEARLLDREVRSFEAAYVNGLWHWDCHHGSKKVLTSRGEWRTPILFGVLDDRSRLACHLQWYLAETAEIIAHGLSQAFQKRGLPRSGLSDNGAAMTAAEITEGLTRLGILHQTTLPYSPYQNAKQEAFWGPVEGRLIAMLEDVPDLTLAVLNEATQAWVEYEYNRKVHSEIGEAPITRFLAGPEVTRSCPDSDTLRLTFTRTDQRMQRKSDGTVVIEGRRFEVPNRYRHLSRIEVRYAGWDLGLVHLVDERTGTVLARLFPQDKTQNASGLRRTLDPISPAPIDVKPAAGIAPLLARLIDRQAATGLPPPYLPKDEQGDDT